MKKLKPIVFASLLVLALPLMAQEGHPHHGAPALAEIAPAPAGKGGCDKCKTMGLDGKMTHGDGMGDMDGMGGKMAHGDGKGGMMCCKSKHGGGSEVGGKSCCGGMRGGDTLALEQRISELEKRLDQMQKQLKPARKAP